MSITFEDEMVFIVAEGFGAREDGGGGIGEMGGH
jgi:hypothetical protein